MQKLCPLPPPLMGWGLVFIQILLLGIEGNVKILHRKLKFCNLLIGKGRRYFTNIFVLDIVLILEGPYNVTATWCNTDMRYPVMSLQHDATSFLHIFLDLWDPFMCGTSDSKWGQHFLEVYFKIRFCLIYRMWAILSNPQIVLHLSHNLPAEWNLDFAWENASEYITQR